MGGVDHSFTGSVRSLVSRFLGIRRCLEFFNSLASYARDPLIFAMQKRDDGNVKNRDDFFVFGCAKMLALTLVLSLGVAGEAMADCRDGGIYCGDDCAAEGSTCHWEINSEGKLTISGSGAMKDNSYSTRIANNVSGNRLTTASYSQYWDKITSIDVGSGITTTGTNAFQGLSKVTSATISKDVVDLPDFAFDRMPSLKSVEFENGSKLTSIGKAAFQYTSLESIDIPKDVKSLDQNAFNKATSLAHINFDEDSQLTSIGQAAFQYTSLESIDIPKGVTSIGQNAFNNATSLALVNFDEDSQLTSIGSGAFQKSQLTSIDIPDSVTSIGQNAFRGNQLTSVEIPDGVTIIGNCAFCIQGYLDENGQWVPTLTDVTLGDSLESIGRQAFHGNKIKNLVIMDSVSLGKSAIVMDSFDANIICKGSEDTCVALINDNDKIAKFNHFIDFDEDGRPTNVDIEPNGTFTNINIAKDEQCNSAVYYYSGESCLKRSGGINCAGGYAEYKDKCWSELPFAKKHWTPAEANEWLNEDDNTVTLTFKKQ